MLEIFVLILILLIGISIFIKLTYDNESPEIENF